jgi:hypothetical protein
MDIRFLEGLREESLLGLSRVLLNNHIVNHFVNGFNNHPVSAIIPWEQVRTRALAVLNVGRQGNVRPLLMLPRWHVSCARIMSASSVRTKKKQQNKNGQTTEPQLVSTIRSERLVGFNSPQLVWEWPLFPPATTHVGLLDLLAINHRSLPCPHWAMRRNSASCHFVTP